MLALRTREELYAVLLLDRGTGPVEARLLDGPLTAETIHLLPRAPLVLPEDWRKTQRADYAPGLLTRKGVTVVVGLRTTPWDDASSRALTAELERLAARPDGRSTALQAWLEQRGCAVRSFRFSAP